MMRTLLSHPSIDEVLLLHANSHTAFEFVHNKVINIDAIEENEEMGLGLKYYYCQFTKNKWVLHLDDDIEFTTDALNELFVEFGRNPRRLVGRYGRNISKKNKGYEPKDVHKSAEVILSRLMVMERDTCSAFFKYSYLLWNDVILTQPCRRQLALLIMQSLIFSLCLNEASPLFAARGGAVVKKKRREVSGAAMQRLRPLLVRSNIFCNANPS